MEKPRIVFDGDDTLWLVEHLYDRARNLAREAVERAGLDGAQWEAAERRIDVANVARFGVSSVRFPTSCVEAIAEVADGLTGPELDHLQLLVRETAKTVFLMPAPAVDGAADVLASLQGDFTLVLLTKGEPRVQDRRIDESGLRDRFDRVLIVPTKGPAEFMTALDGDPAAAAWSVGNSIASDISPALKLGMSAVWIDAHVWEHERREQSRNHPQLYVADTLHDVPQLVRTHAVAPR